MDKLWQSLCAVVLAAGSFLFGSPDGLLLTLLAFILMDYATGLLAAISARRLSSSVGFRGLLRKMLILAMVGVQGVVEMVVCGIVATIVSKAVNHYLKK